MELNQWVVEILFYFYFIFLISNIAISATIENKNIPKAITNVCAACHGIDGNSAIAANPKLAGQHPEYLYKQLINFKSGERANAVMSGMAAMLSESDMHAISDYFSKQTLNQGQAKANGKGSLGEKFIDQASRLMEFQLAHPATVLPEMAFLLNTRV